MTLSIRVLVVEESEYAPGHMRHNLINAGSQPASARLRTICNYMENERMCLRNVSHVCMFVGLAFCRSASSKYVSKLFEEQNQRKKQPATGSNHHPINVHNSLLTSITCNIIHSLPVSISILTLAHRSHLRSGIRCSPPTSTSPESNLHFPGRSYCP